MKRFISKLRDRVNRRVVDFTEGENNCDNIG